MQVWFFVGLYTFTNELSFEIIKFSLLIFSIFRPTSYITEFDDDFWSTFGYTIVGALSLFNNSSKRALFSSFVRFGSSTKYYPDEESFYKGVLSDNYIGLF